MPGTIQGKQGMTKAKKREFRLASMGENRKREKAAQRASYHREFDRMPGRPPIDLGKLGVTSAAKAAPTAPVKVKVVGSFRHLHRTVRTNFDGVIVAQPQEG